MQKIFRLCVFVLSFWIVSLAHASEPSTFINDYEILLKSHVKSGEKQSIRATLVDYIAWGKNPLHEEALAALQSINPKTLTGDEKMAFWINAYNLLTIDLIVKTKEMESIKNQGSLFRNVWKSHVWRIHDKTYTLDEIEHSILRPMGDPRIHAAINCASLSCPDLRLEPYAPAQLDAQLDDQIKQFFLNETKGLGLTSSGLRVSKIFKWFAVDFGGQEGVLRFIQGYFPHLKGTKIADYFEYNWQLNSRSR